MAPKRTAVIDKTTEQAAGETTTSKNFKDIVLKNDKAIQEARQKTIKELNN